ncbi:cell division protein FtsQ/DivIB [Maritalea sp.]|uniref:cell division protein FtsQ/DivIB n=1 Tax=Maritalea sp. TaxID=2003361 RepID=UPI003EF1F869
MQQIKRDRTGKAIAMAQPLGADLIFRRATHVVVARWRNLWVLHKRLAVRLIALLLVAGIGAAGLYSRNHLANYWSDVSGGTSALFAQAGLSVAELSLSGYALTNEELLFEAVGLEANLSLVNFDADAARLRLEALPSIETATIRKIYPNSLIVDLTEKKPVAIWIVDGVNFAIDQNGNRIAPIETPIEGLPMFIGDGAADDVPAFITMLNKFPALTEGLLASSRIGDRRWDLIYDFGLRIMLPETGVEQALTQIAQLETEQQLFARDIEVLDMRIADYLAVRVVDRTPVEEEIAQ